MKVTPRSSSVSSRSYWSYIFAALIAITTGVAAPLVSHAQPGTHYASTTASQCTEMFGEIGDTNGDGVRDILCGNYHSNPQFGAVRVLSGRRTTQETFSTLASFAIAGLEKAIEVRVGSIRYVAACAAHYAGFRLVVLNRQTLQLVAERPLDFACHDMEASDQDGDGIEELLLTTRPTPTAEAPPRIFIFKLALSGAVVTITQFLTRDLHLPHQSTHGFTLAILGDLNGDGVDELAVGAPASDGRIALLDGGTSVSAPRQLISGEAAAELGADMTTGDINGDDQKELLATAPGDRALKVYDLSSGLLNEIASITRPGKAPFGASIAAQVTDVNGDNRGDMLVTWPSSADDSGGTAFVSGRTLAVEQTFPGYSLQPALVMKSSHIDLHQLRGAILLGGYIPFPGSSTSGFGYEASIAGFWGCPTTFLEDAHPTSIYAGTDANNGQPPALVGVLGCAVPGGDIVVTGQFAALAPALLLGGTQLNQTPFPSILGTNNRLVLNRQSIVEIASIFVPSSGIAHFPVRNLGDHFFDPDGEGSQPPVFRLLFQAIQFAQWNPGAHPGGGGIASSKGVWLTAIQQ